MENVQLSVSECIALINQTLEYAYPTLLIEGEVSSFKVNKDKYVFFDIKDDTGTLGCFMMIYQLRVPIADGMHVQIVAQPKLTQWGKFSLTVRAIRPVGEGSIKRSFDALVAKLDKEGLFDPARKRTLPALPSRIGVITSTQAAGYIDFTTILNQRWGGMEVLVANTQVQGFAAAPQIIKALDHFNQMSQPPEVIVIVRGGGSADDLSVFNDEPLVRALAASRVPTLVGVGHEVDTTLADMVADVRAVTPTNAAQILVPDRHEIIVGNQARLRRALDHVGQRAAQLEERVIHDRGRILTIVVNRHEHMTQLVQQQQRTLRQLNPENALKRGYALVRSENGALIRQAKAVRPGDVLSIEIQDAIIKAGVTDVNEK